MRKHYFLFLTVLLPILQVFSSLNPCDQKKSKDTCCQAPIAWPQLKEDTGLSVAADFLYWQANQAAMAYGSINNYISTPNFIGSYKNIDFEFSPGVRTSLGIRPHYDFWQINVIWTYLDSKASGAVQLPVGGPTTVTPEWRVPVVGTNGTGAKAAWWAHYNTLDLDITRELNISNYFGLKAHVGVRNLWLHEKYYILTIGNSGGFVGHTYNSNGIFTEKIWGIGPMLGMDSSYKVGYGLSLFGKATFSLLWSNVHTGSTGTYLISPPITSNKLTALFHETLPEIGLLVGAAYDANFSNDRYHLGLRLGWELHTLFDANFLTADFRSNGNFNLSGLTTGFDFDF